jgi:hypothetical protein
MRDASASGTKHFLADQTDPNACCESAAVFLKIFYFP